MQERESLKLSFAFLSQFFTVRNALMFPSTNTDALRIDYTTSCFCSDYYGVDDVRLATHRFLIIIYIELQWKFMGKKLQIPFLPK